MRLALGLLALAALAAGTSCGSTKACKDGTLFLTLTFDGTTSSADQVTVQVTPSGGASRMSTLEHQAGATVGTVEIDFPQGYPAGSQVQVTVTASKAGAAIATATGTVVLTSGCSALAIALGGGGQDGGAGSGGKGGSGGGGGATGTGGAAGTSAGTAGTGAAGTGAAGTGTAGTGTAGRGGAAGTGAAGTTGCVFQSAEDCFDGIDNDCNGMIDCADPACAPQGECVAAGNTNFKLGVEANPTDTCPTNFTGGETALNQGLVVPVATTCTGCSCAASTTCSIGLYQYASVAACTADTTLTGGTLVGSQLNSASLTCEMGTLNAPAYRIGSFTKTDSAYTPSGTAAKPAVSWTTQKKFCAAARTGAGCSPGYVCAPKQAQLSSHCVRADGALACPAGYNAMGSGWYKDFTDARTCGACSCGAQTPGDCTKETLSGSTYNRNLQFWPTSSGSCSSSSGYGTTISSAPGTQTCCALQCAATTCGTTGVACSYYGFVYPPVTASCPASSTLSGTATATSAETLCCL